MFSITKHKVIAVGLIFLSFFAVLYIFWGGSKEDDKLYANLYSKNYRIFSTPLPENLTFCSEPVPLNLFDVRERLDREILINVFWQSQTLMLHKRAARWFPVIEPILKRNGVPADFKYLSLIESGFQNVVSPSDAVGFWQFLEETGKKHGLEINGEVDERYSVEKSTEAACKYLIDAKQKLGSWTAAAASYNMGVNGFRKQAEFQETFNYYEMQLNNETSRYLFRILAIKEIMASPKKYGFYLRKKDLYPPIETFSITVDSSISNLSNFARANKSSYKILKIFNPWLREKSLNNKSKKAYTIELPLPGFENYEHLLSEMPPRTDDSIYAFDYEKINRESDRNLGQLNKIHKVKSGETIESIAKLYNCDPVIIREKNKLKTVEQPITGSEIIVGC